MKRARPQKVTVPLTEEQEDVVDAALLKAELSVTSKSFATLSNSSVLAVLLSIAPDHQHDLIKAIDAVKRSNAMPRASPSVLSSPLPRPLPRPLLSLALSSLSLAVAFPSCLLFVYFSLRNTKLSLSWSTTPFAFSRPRAGACREFSGSRAATRRPRLELTEEKD